jgi:hypothetical protein
VRALDARMVSRVARILTEVLGSRNVAALLTESGLAATSDEAAAVTTQLTSRAQHLVEIALTEALEHDREHLAEIRQFFLQPEETYSIKELAALWRLSLDDVRDVFHDEITRWEFTSGKEGVETNAVPRIPWAKAVATSAVFNLMRPFDIERALGDDFGRVRTERWRTVPILIHLPHLVANAFELDASIPPRLALASKVERILLELFTTEHLSAADANEAGHSE